MPRSRSLLRTAIIAGLIAGTLDILDPILFFWLRAHIRPERILQSVAAGLLGRSAYTGGWPTAAFGLLLHFSSPWPGPRYSSSSRATCR